MKKLLVFILSVRFVSAIFGQSMANYVISAGGENIVTSNSKIQFTIGESVTLESSKTTLGFHSIFSKYLKVADYHYSNDNQLYPNPIEDYLNVCIKNLESHLIIRNVNSEILLSKTLTEYNSVIDFTNYNSGIYVIEINDAVKRKSYKFIKI